MDRPRARRDGLLQQPVGEELLLYDQQRQRLYCLHPAAAQLWQACDGRRTLEELAALVAGEPGGDSRTICDAALARLDYHGLLERSESWSCASSRRVRRRLLQRVGSTILASTAVSTIAAPTPAMAATCIAEADCNALRLGLCCLRDNGQRRKCRMAGGIFLCNGDGCTCT